MRIALAVDGTRGDVQPMLALAARFMSEGHAVVMCGPPDAQPDCEAQGVLFRPMGVDARQFLDQEAEGIARGRLGFARAGARYFKATVARQFDRLPDATRDVDVIFGAGLCFAGASAGELHGIPYRTVAYCPILLPSSEYAPFFAPSTRTPRWLNRLLWSTLVPGVSKLVGIEINRRRCQLGLRAERHIYRHLLSERPVLAADPTLAPAPADSKVSVDTIAYLHPQPGEALPEKLEAFLAAGPPPVYLGFGSMTDPDPDATTALILRAVERAGCRAIVSTGWAGLGDGPLPENVFRAGALDHARLFPRVAAVIHHGGAGTTTTAARAGAPQIIVPHGVDQYYWAARVHALGVAPPPLPRTRLRADRLAESLTAVLENELLSTRAGELAERVRDNSLRMADPITILPSC